MNYIVTDKHSLYKAGVVIYQDREWYDIKWKSGFLFTFNQSEIDQWLKDGWIVEQQKPEFTKDDCKEFAEIWVRDFAHNIGNLNQCFDKWLTNRKKS